MIIEGRILRAARGLLGWTQAEIAQAAAVSVSYVKYLENNPSQIGSGGRRKVMSVFSVFTSNGIFFLVADEEIRGVFLDEEIGFGDSATNELNSLEDTPFLAFPDWRNRRTTAAAYQTRDP